MANLLEDRLEKPYSDELLTYNYKENRYVLTVDASKHSGLDLELLWQGRANAEKYLDLVSRALYTYIFHNKDSKYHDKFKWIFSHSKKFREEIYQAFQDIIWYNHRDGGFLVAYNTGVNLSQMAKLDIEIDMAVSVIGKSHLLNSGLMELIPRHNILQRHKISDFKQFKEFLVEQGVLTEEKAEKVETLNDIPKSMEYRLYKDFKGNYTYDDFTFWDKELSKQGDEW